MNHQAELSPAVNQWASKANPIKTAIVFGILIALMVIMWLVVREALADHGDTQGIMVGLLIVAGIGAMILVTIGYQLGSKHHIVIYDSRADLYLTFASIVAWSVSSFGIGIMVSNVLVGGIILILSIIPTIISIARSCKANKTVWEALLAILSKYAFVVVIIMLCFITIQSAFAAVENVKKKKYEDAAANALTAAVGAAGFWKVRKLINNLIAVPSFKELQAVRGSQQSTPAKTSHNY